MRSISLLCPTRGRPERFRDMVLSAVDTVEAPDLLSLEVRLDEDDPLALRYPMPRDIRTAFRWGPRVKVPAAFNELARSSTGSILMACADDVLFRTPGWDRRVREALAAWPDGLGIAVPNDGAGRGRRCTAWFCGRELVALLGWHHPESYEHFYCDTHVADLMQRAGRIAWLDQVLIEHMHPNRGKAAVDQTYAEKRQGEKGSRASDRDRDLYHSLARQRILDAERILAAAGGRQ